MRTYIFTERERSIVKAFLSGEKTYGLDLARIKYVVRTFKRLGGDVELYLRFREAATARST
ncbi:MAG: hypothetical protein QW160_04545 [Candidatus Bathyarchaeia archaeon]